MQAMSKHALLMRKNVIRLEMLRGPPQPPQMHQSQFIMPHPGMIQPGMGPPPRGMMPPLRMDAGPPGMMQHTAHPGFPGFVGSRMPPPVPRLPPMFPPRMWHPTPPVGHPMNAGHLAMRHPEPARWNSSEPLINPRGMPLPIGSSGKFFNLTSGNIFCDFPVFS